MVGLGQDMNMNTNKLSTTVYIEIKASNRTPESVARIFQSVLTEAIAKVSLDYPSLVGVTVGTLDPLPTGMDAVITPVSEILVQI